jgi:hypothetical protein
MPDLHAQDRDAPASPLDAAQVLEDAADLLLTRGRCQNSGRSAAGEFCALGALYEVIEPGWWRGSSYTYWNVVDDEHPAAVALAAHLGDADHCWTIADWNDATTDDFEVIDTLRHVAKDLRNEATA